MEDFKKAKSNLDLAFISYSEFIEQWKEALREHGLILSFDMDKKLREINEEYQAKCREFAKELLEKQGWLAE